MINGISQVKIHSKDYVLDHPGIIHIRREFVVLYFGPQIKCLHHKSLGCQHVDYTTAWSGKRQSIASLEIRPNQPFPYILFLQNQLSNN